MSFAEFAKKEKELEAARGQVASEIAKAEEEKKQLAAELSRLQEQVAEETRKARAADEKKAAEHLKESMHQRDLNMKYAKEHGHWDWAIKRQPDFALPKDTAASAEKIQGE